MRIVVAITGASGGIYALYLLNELKKKGIEICAIITEYGEKIMGYETGKLKHEIEEMVDELYSEKDMESPLASGSFQYDAMVVIPCSLKTLASIANGMAINLVVRTAICCLKEGRKLIVVPRETPLDLISLENMVKLKKAGAIILPAMPAFYHKPEKVDDLIYYIVGKVMDLLYIENSLYKRWR
ncbi:MAG TPA: UbiX family flavin prenyltransferase [Thermoplasmata archaeon]|nr:UbiX family flavin prenyltransferase [Thermoplasmata archaeon]